jgi:hypothetical protein
MSGRNTVGRHGSIVACELHRHSAMATQGRFLCLRTLVLASAAVATACGDGIAAGDAGGADMDAGPSGDAAPPPACGREIGSLGQTDHVVTAAIDDTHVYLLDDGSPPGVRVWRVDRTTGAIDLLATVEGDWYGEPLRVGQDAVYIATVRDDSGSLYRVDKQGDAGAAEVLAPDLVGGLAIDNTHLYWSGFEAADVPALRRRSQATGEAEVLLEGYEVLEAKVAVLGDFLYWNEDEVVRRMPTAGGASELVGTLEGASAAPFVDVLIPGSDDRLYWFQSPATGHEGELFRASPDLFVPDRLVTEPTNPFDSQMWLIDGWLYWQIEGVVAGEARGTRRLRVAGGEVETIYPGIWAAFVPTPDGIYVAEEDTLRLLPLVGCSE